ncbi:MAG: hypothetical protein NVS9B14_04570 [Candidatus Acidiferrum sp.]
MESTTPTTRPRWTHSGRGQNRLRLRDTAAAPACFISNPASLFPARQSQYHPGYLWFLKTLYLGKELG